jgi:hypothetical protein
MKSLDPIGRLLSKLSAGHKISKTARALLAVEFTECNYNMRNKSHIQARIFLQKNTFEGVEIKDDY